MNDNKCLLCGLPTDETRQICLICEKSLEPHKELLWAAFNRVPVEFRGVNYGCISAFIFRTRVASRVPIKKRCIFQVELMSAKSHCIIYADPKEVKVLKDWRPPNE